MQWLPELDAQLRQLAGTMANTDVAAKMSRTLRSIEHRASRLGISLAFIVERNRPWSREDDETLRSQAGTKPPAEIAAALGRTEDAVIHRGIVIGVPMGFKRTPRCRQRWDEIRVLVDEGLAPPQIARRMGLPIRAIRQRLGAMGLRAKADGRGCPVGSYSKLSDLQKLLNQGKDTAGIARWMDLPETEIEELVRCHQLRPMTSEAAAERKPKSRQAKAKPVRKMVRVTVSRVAYCESCGAPVINTPDGWASHRARVHTAQRKAPLWR